MTFMDFLGFAAKRMSGSSISKAHGLKNRPDTPHPLLLMSGGPRGRGPEADDHPLKRPRDTAGQEKLLSSHKSIPGDACVVSFWL